MPRTIVRTVLVGISPVLMLGLAGPTVMETDWSGRVAITHPHIVTAGAIGTIRNAGLGGPDRLTAVAEATLHEVPPLSVAAQPPAVPPAWRPAAGAAPAPPAASVSRPVGGAAGQEFTLINQDRTAGGARTLSWS